MLRGRQNNDQAPTLLPDNRPPGLVSTDFPGVERAFEIGERPPGILFYRAKESFWLPYHLLQCIEFEHDNLRLAFASDHVVITGHALHGLYVDLARQTVIRVIEQGERYAALAEGGTLVARIDRLPRTKDE